MLKPSINASNGCTSVFRESVLFVDADPELRDSRRLLLSSLHLPVHTVESYAEVFQLPEPSHYNLVVLNIHPNERQASNVAEYVRRRWPQAKVLLLGDTCGSLPDPLYDDIVNPYCNPAGFVHSAQNLLEWTRTGRIVR